LAPPAPVNWVGHLAWTCVFFPPLPQVPSSAVSELFKIGIVIVIVIIIIKVQISDVCAPKSTIKAAAILCKRVSSPN
jgi:hypothetical protein